MGNSIQQYRSSIGKFHSKICSSSQKLRSSTNAKEKLENNINVILHVLTIAIIRAEVNNLFSSFISVICHIINNHMLDYFELTGKTLLNVSDEITEAAHSALRIFDERHGYKNLGDY